MNDPTLIADLICAGVAPELVARVATELAEARAEGAALQARRMSDRERKARQRHVSSREFTSLHVSSREWTQQAVENTGGDHEVHVTSREPLKETPHTPQETTPQFPQSTTPSAPSTAPKGADRGRRLPDDWRPSDALTAFAAGLGFVGHAFDQAVAEFRDYWRGVPGQRARKLDWDATFRNRLRETARSQKKGRSNEQGKRSIIDAADKAVRWFEEQAMRAADGGGSGEEAVRLLPGLRPGHWPAVAEPLASLDC